MQEFTNLRSACVYGGGESKYTQLNQIRRTKPQVIIATPGRLLDMLESRELELSEVQFQILDEGDRMLDMGFQQDIEKILKYLPGSVTSMIFSATVPKFIQELST